MTGWGDTLRGAGTCAAAIAVATIACASVHVVGGADDARVWFAFDFPTLHGEFGDAAEIAAHNLRLVAAPYLATVVVRAAPRARRITDVALGLVLVANAALVGAAVAAYGAELAPILVPHVLLELLAFSVAGGVYRAGSRSVPVTTGISAAATTVATLLAAACAEAQLLE